MTDPATYTKCFSIFSANTWSATKEWYSKRSSSVSLRLFFFLFFLTILLPSGICFSRFEFIFDLLVQLCLLLISKLDLSVNALFELFSFGISWMIKALLMSLENLLKKYLIDLFLLSRSNSTFCELPFEWDTWYMIYNDDVKAIVLTKTRYFDFNKSAMFVFSLISLSYIFRVCTFSVIYLRDIVNYYIHIKGTLTDI